MDSDKRGVQCCMWSQLVTELLNHILQRLAFPDCLAFGKVCTSWRSALLTRQNLLHPPPCMMLIPANERMPIQAPLWSLHGGRFLKLSSPRNFFLQAEQIIGYSLGWLVIGSNEPSNMQLLNTTSNKRILLPSTVSDGTQMRLLSNHDHCFTVRHVDLSSVPTSADCVLVATGFHGYILSFAWCRLGDREWIIFDQPSGFIEQTMFHKGEFYVLRRQEYLLDGYTENIVVYAFDPQLKLASYTLSTICSNCWFKRLVESGGELLKVVGGIAIDGLKSLKLDVFKLAEKQQGGRWVRVESLGDRVLLIGKRGAVSFCIHELLGSGFEANCVYYHARHEGVLVKFSMGDGSIRRISLPHGGLTFEWIMKKVWQLNSIDFLC